jgi:hypothetical protein
MQELHLDDLLSNTKLTDILNKKGHNILLGITMLCKEKGVAKEIDDIILEINDIVGGKPWLFTIVAFFFWIDELLKENPASEKIDEEKKFNALIDFIEWELKKKNQEE